MSGHGLEFHMLNHLQVGYLKYLSFLHEIDLFFNFKNFFYKKYTGRYRFARPRQLRNWDRDFIRDTVNLPNACPQTPDTFFGNFSGK